jgi:putative oxidoreductase
MIRSIQYLYGLVFGAIKRASSGWLIGLAARLVFLAVFFFYYLNSFFNKVGEGFAGFFQIQGGAYFQIVPAAMEAAQFDPANVSLSAHLMVYFGTYAELILPCLIIIGLLTRAAALGMIGFIAVQTYVDINFHGTDEKTLGRLFDTIPDSVISDQRTLWIFVMLVLVINGAGYFSIDFIFGRKRSV